MEKQNLTKIRGIVLAAGWKKNGAVSALDIAGYDEKKYRVVNDEMGKQLRAYLHQQVTVDGAIIVQKNRLIIHVHHFQIDASCLKHPTR